MRTDFGAGIRALLQGIDRDGPRSAVVSQRSTVNGRLATVVGRRSMVSGQWSTVHRPLSSVLCPRSSIFNLRSYVIRPLVAESQRATSPLLTLPHPSCLFPRRSHPPPHPPPSLSLVLPPGTYCDYLVPHRAHIPLLYESLATAQCVLVQVPAACSIDYQTKVRIHPPSPPPLPPPLSPSPARYDAVDANYSTVKRATTLYVLAIRTVITIPDEQSTPAKDQPRPERRRQQLACLASGRLDQDPISIQ